MRQSLCGPGEVAAAPASRGAWDRTGSSARRPCSPGPAERPEVRCPTTRPEPENFGTSYYTNHEKFFGFSDPSVGSAGPADRTHLPERQRPAEPAGPAKKALLISPRPFSVWYYTTPVAAALCAALSQLILGKVVASPWAKCTAATANLLNHSNRRSCRPALGRSSCRPPEQQTHGAHTRGPAAHRSGWSNSRW
jgi:hypothetical protein